MRNEPTKRRFPFGILLGVAVGIALGASLGSIPIGIGVGAALAVLFGLFVDRRRRDSA